MITKFLFSCLAAGLFLMTPFSLSAQCPGACNCEPGAEGPIGAQGPDGPQGPIGPQGVTGPAGATGNAGLCCASGLPGFVNVYSQVAQTISPFGAPGDTVLFEGLNISSSHFDTSLASTTGSVVVLADGTYKIDYTAEGRVLTVPFVWTLGLYLDSALIPGSTFGNYDDEPLATSAAGSVIIDVSAGQAISLRSNSSAPFTLFSGVGVNPVTSASLKITVLSFGI